MPAGSLSSLRRSIATLERGGTACQPSPDCGPGVAVTARGPYSIAVTFARRRVIRRDVHGREHL